MSKPGSNGKLLVSPTEPAMLRKLGESSSIPEEYGVDFLWYGENGEMYGLQRKEFKDLVASVHDGRLQKELQQMQSLDWKGKGWSLKM